MFHKEGFNIIILFFIVVSMDVIILEVLFEEPSTIKSILQTSALIVLLLILWFFRNQKRNINKTTDHIISPADGKIVNIEEVFENEFFKDKRLQVSIFLSPLDVHVNRYPVSGEVTYSKHHHGKYLVAKFRQLLLFFEKLFFIHQRSVFLRTSPITLLLSNPNFTRSSPLSGNFFFL